MVQSSWLLNKRMHHSNKLEPVAGARSRVISPVGGQAVTGAFV